MDEADRKRIAELNEQADAKTDRLLGLAISSSYTSWIMAAALIVAFWIGWWARG